MKGFIVLALAVLGGAWLWSKYKASGKTISTVSISDFDFNGRKVDATTGAYLAPGSRPGTASFSTDNTNGLVGTDNGGAKL